MEDPLLLLFILISFFGLMSFVFGKKVFGKGKKTSVLYG